MTDASLSDTVKSTASDAASALGDAAESAATATTDAAAKAADTAREAGGKAAATVERTADKAAKPAAAAATKVEKAADKAEKAATKAGEKAAEEPVAPPVRSLDEIEADLDDTRARLAERLDALAEYVTPRNLVGRQVDKVKGVFVDEYGGIKPEPILIGVGVVVAIVGIRLLRRRGRD